MPSNAEDVAGLLRSAMRSNNPTLFFEHSYLVDAKAARRPYPGDEFIVPLGKARTVREGDELTVVTWGAMVERCELAAEQVGGSIEIIDLRTVAPWDRGAVLESVKKTSRCVVVHEETITAVRGARSKMSAPPPCHRVHLPSRRTTMPAIALSSRRGRSAVRAAFLPAVILLASACGDSVPATAPPSLNKGGKPGGSAESPVVTRTSPASADRGLTLEVRVLGDGFDDGSLAEWAFQGVVDPAQVRTNSTRFVSARELLANITISSEAVLGLYDVQVTTTKGKKGVAIEAFEVTLATECGSRTTNLDSRAMLQWDGSLAIVGDEGNAPYRGGEGGVHAKIFYHNAVCSRSGDAVFDPDMNGGATRKLIFRFPAGHVTGLSGDVAVGPFVNFFAIMQLGSDVNGDGAVTSGRDAKIHAKYPGSVLSLEYHATTAEWPGYTHGIHPRIRFQSTSIKECEALEYDRVRATRTLGTFVPTGQHASDGLALGEWLVSVMGEWVIESVGASADGSGPHLAQCFRKQGSSLVPNGSQIHMPFRVTLKEFRP